MLAVRGQENENGMFEVSEVGFVNPYPLDKTSIKPMQVDSGSKYIAIVSGLSVGSQKTDIMAVRAPALSSLFFFFFSTLSREIYSFLILFLFLL